ncbi:MAG: MBL fold metallo-hydrolase, partial [Candidatus Micrarchaeota archaeon]
GCNEKFGVPVYIHRRDLELLKDARLNLSSLIGTTHSATYQILPLEDKQTIGLKDVQMQVIHTPGHTAGGICLLMKKPKDKILLSGDTLFCHGVGRADFPGASESQLLRSIRERLLVLPDDTVVYPGHGPSTTIAAEKANNPFLSGD